jgi:hypothetical protein
MIDLWLHTLDKDMASVLTQGSCWWLSLFRLTTIDRQTAMELAKNEWYAIFLSKNIQVSPDVKDILNKSPGINMRFEDPSDISLR